MIDWIPTAKRLGYESEETMWEDLYVTRGLSIRQLAEKLDVSRNTVRISLERLKIEVRKRGGPNNQKLQITPALLEEIKENGISAVAKRLDLAYTTVYKRIYRIRPLVEADLHPDDVERLPEIAAAAAEPSVDSEDVSE